MSKSCEPGALGSRVCVVVLAVVALQLGMVNQAHADATFFVTNPTTNSVEWISAVESLGGAVNSNVNFNTVGVGTLPLNFYTVSDGVTFSTDFPATIASGTGPNDGNTDGSNPGEGSHPASNHLLMTAPSTDVMIISFDEPVIGAGLFTIDFFGPFGARNTLAAYSGVNGTGTLLGSVDSFVANFQPNNLYFMGVSDPDNVIRSIVFTHNPGFTGDDMGVDDVLFATAPTCFVVDAIDDQFALINDGTAAEFKVLQNDDCKADTPVSVVVQSGDLEPDRGGSAITNGTTVSYVPAPGFAGFEEFSYTAQDAGLAGGDQPPTVDMDTARVVVNVLEDIVPVTVDDFETTQQFQNVIIDVLANDSLGNGPTHELAIETGPVNGSVLLLNDDTIRYTPNFDFFGEDTFEYRITDSNGDSDVGAVSVGVFFVRGEVVIDIKPSDDGNNFNLRAGQGAATSVAILSVGEFFDAPNLIDPLTLKFGPRQANIWGSPQIRDVDGDGDDDLIVKFLTQQTGIACGDTQASLFGRTFDRQSISGSDAINTFNCPRIRKRH